VRRRWLAHLLRSDYAIKLTANVCIAPYSSRNAVSFSSAPHNETLSIAMCVNNPDCSSFKVER
jgi:hypothetical protein